MFDGVIFDWAGTTVDFGSMAPVIAIKEAFAKWGIEVTGDEIRKPMGRRKWDHIQTMLHMERIQKIWKGKYGRLPDRADTDALYQDFEPALMKVLARYTTVKPGTKEVMAALRERGYQIGSTTGYTDSMMDIVIPAAAKNGYKPDFWITPDEVQGLGRPYPYMIFRNMENFHWPSTGRILKIGDTTADIAEGRNAGVHTAAVLIGSSVMGLDQETYEALSATEQREYCDQAAAVFKQAGAEYIFKDLHDMLNLL